MKFCCKYWGRSVGLGTAGDLYPFPAPLEDPSNLQTTEVVVRMIIFFTACAWSSKMLFADSVVGKQVVYHLALVLFGSAYKSFLVQHWC